MKKLLKTILFSSLLISSKPALYAQTSPAKLWDKSIGGNSWEYFEDAQPTADGGYILGGRSDSQVSGDKTQPRRGFYFDYWIVKINANGVKKWDKTFGGNSTDEFRSVSQTSDGGYILGGHTNSGLNGDKTEASKGATDYWIVRVDSLGNKLWDKTIGGSLAEYLAVVKQTADGGFIIGGTSNSNITGDKSETSKGITDYWIVKLDASGNKLWDKTIGGSSQEDLYDLQITSDGGFILGGSSSSGISGDKSQAVVGQDDYWIVKVDGNGVKQWDKTFGSTSSDGLYSIRQTLDGGYILGGECSGAISGDKSEPSKGGFDYWVVKISSTGIKQWDRTLGGSDYDYFGDLNITSDGGYLIAGASLSPVSGDKSTPQKGYTDYWIVKLNSNGNKEWDKTLGGIDGMETLNSIYEKPDGSIFIGGSSNSGLSGDKSQASKGDYDFWPVLLKSPCADLTATLSAVCANGGSVIVTVSGLPPTLPPNSAWTLTYTVNNTTQTATGTTQTFTLASNISTTAVYSLVSITSGPCTKNLSNSLSVEPTPAAPTVTHGSNCGSGTVNLSATGGLTGNSYSWYSSMTSATPLSNNVNGTFTTPILSSTTTYYVAIRNNNNCESPRSAVTATINTPPVVSVGPALSLCESAAPFQLSGFSPTGGTWSGTGVDAAGLFTPSSSLIGSHTLTYTVTQNGCSASATLVITVTPTPVITTGLTQSICESAAPIQLTGFSPAGGTWSGSGVSASGLFTPANNLIGNQTLTYAITQNGCTVSATQTITVTAAPVVSAGIKDTVCTDSVPYQLTGASPIGGTWSGSGVNAAGLFTPSATLIGTQTLTYSYSQDGCTVTATKQVVIPTPPVQPVITLYSSDTLMASTSGSSYEWKHNNTVIPGNKQKLKVTTNGTYAVRVKDAKNCASTFSADYTYTVSGRKEVMQNQFSLYPNPTSGLLILELATAQPAEVTVFNALGQQILQKTVAKTDEKVQLDLSKVAKGIYLVQVQTEKQVVVKKIVVE